jgi:hypothetical protein
LLGGFSADADDEVFGGDFAYVADGVGGHGGGEDDAAGADVLGFAVVLEGDRALANEKDVGGAVLVEGVGGGADGDGGLVDLEVLAGEGCSVGDGAGLAAVGVLLDGEVFVEEDAGGGEDGLGWGGLGFGAWGYGQGGEGGEQVAAVHGWNLTLEWDGWGRELVRFGEAHISEARCGAPGLVTGRGVRSRSRLVR